MIYLFTTTVKTFYIKQGGKQIMKGKYLKKWMSVFLSTALAISSISGCGNSDKEPTDSTDKSANETTDTANKDTASDEASDVQDGDTPLIGSWIDLSYGIQVKIEKDAMGIPAAAQSGRFHDRSAGTYGGTARTVQRL